MKKKYFSSVLFILFAMISGGSIWAQGPSCGVSDPFCAGSDGATIVFQNSSNIPSGGSPACLGSTPNPAWFYMQIGESGDLQFLIQQTTGGFTDSGAPIGSQIDVDFVAYGPFDSEVGGCSELDDCDSCGNNQTDDGYPYGNVVDCSYSGSWTETLTINDAVEGDYYLVLMTNYNGSPGYILLTQTNEGNTGAGATDCSILDPALGEDINVCEGFGPIEIDGTTENASSYQWGVLNETTGDYEDIAGETNPFITVTETGTYQVTTYDATNDDYASANITVTYHEVPVAIEIEDDTVCVESFPTSVDLFPYNASILGSLDPDQFDLSYHATQANADAGSNALGNLPFSEEGCSTVYVRIENIDLNECYDTIAFQICAYETAEVFPLTSYELCADPVTGDAIFDLGVKDVEALGDQIAADYSV
ncbi:MAG TPA: hypothetical protein VFM70_07800, partial [Salinimicrobium sp.]|nr:hypothetical protein [Salinimicrobium sp.]